MIRGKWRSILIAVVPKSASDMSDQPSEVPKLPHPFALGSVVPIVLGTLALYIEMNNLTSFQWPWAATIGAALIFGYFPSGLAC